MFAKFFRSSSLFLALALFAMAPRAIAAPEEVTGTTLSESAAASATGDAHAADAGEHGKETATRPVFEPEHGTWFNILARNLFATQEEKQHTEEQKQQVELALSKAEKNQPLTAKEQENEQLVESYEAAVAQKQGKTLTEEQHNALEVHYVTKYDFLLYTPLLWGLLAFTLVSAARKTKIRPAGKPASSANLTEAAVDGFQNYLIGVMGEGLARKYTPLIASFFFTILVSNWLGLIPGMVAATAQPAIPIAMALVAFISVHIIAIKETSVKSWFTHFLGEPLWLAPLNFPLHIVGELIKPLSLSLRLLCNVFGEEAVIITLTTLAVSMLPIWLPIPFQIPMLFLGTFFGFLQALVFSTLLAIYISILATHHDEHGGHEHTEHTHKNGHDQVVGVASASPVA